MKTPNRPTFKNKTDFFPPLLRFSTYAGEGRIEETDAAWTKWRGTQISVPRIEEVKTTFGSLRQALVEARAHKEQLVISLRLSTSRGNNHRRKAMGLGG